MGGPAWTSFGADAETTDANKEVLVDLQLSRIERGSITVKGRYARFGTDHWSAPLDLPSGVQYSVHLVRDRKARGDGALVEQAAVQTGTMIYSEPGHCSAVFPPTHLLPAQNQKPAA